MQNLRTVTPVRCSDERRRGLDDTLDVLRHRGRMMVRSGPITASAPGPQRLGHASSRRVWGWQFVGNCSNFELWYRIYLDRESI